MNALDITIGKTYTIKSGQNQFTVTVKDYDSEKPMWVCETASGKRIGVKDSAKFLAEFSGDPPPLRGSSSPGISRLFRGIGNERACHIL
jgi:hypothetical protein